MRKLNSAEIGILRKNAESAAAEIRRFTKKSIAFDRRGLETLDRVIESLPWTGSKGYDNKTIDLVASIWRIVAADSCGGTWLDKGNSEAILQLSDGTQINTIDMVELRFKLGRILNLASMLDSLGNVQAIGCGEAFVMKRDHDPGGDQ